MRTSQTSPIQAVAAFLLVAIMAVAFLMVLTTTNVPVVYKETGTDKVVKIVWSDGTPVPQNHWDNVLAGRYEIVWAPAPIFSEK